MAHQPGRFDITKAELHAVEGQLVVFCIVYGLPAVALLVPIFGARG